MPGGARKRSQASSSRAAEFLKQKAGSAHLGTGFAGFSGGRALGAQPANEETGVGGLGELDGKVQQCLKHLAKSNSTTKLKALQGLHDEVQQQGVAELLALLPHWIRAYRRLVSDANRKVRVKCQDVLGALVSKLKRELAPHLKSLIGPWWMSQHDADRDVQTAAISAFQGAFTEAKRTEVIIFCHQDLLKYLQDNLLLEMKDLKESKQVDSDELEMHYEYVMSGSLSSIADLLVITSSAGGSDSRQNVADGVTQIISGKPFMKRFFASTNPAIRRASYHLVQEASSRISDNISTHVPNIAGGIVGSIAERDASCQSGAWSMVLTFVKAFPDSWTHIKLHKAILPRLYSYLTHRGYGGESQSYSAVLPFISQIPKPLWEGAPDILIKVFLSTWEGLKGQTQSASALWEAARELMAECLIWGLLSAKTLSPEPKMYQEQLINGTVMDPLLPAVTKEPIVQLKLGKSVIKHTLQKLSELASGDAESSAGVVLKTLLLHIIFFFKTNVSPSKSGANEGDADSPQGKDTDFIVALLLELLPKFKACGLSQLSDQIARPIGALLVSDGISAVSDVAMLRSLSKLTEVLGPAVLSFPGADNHSTDTCILQSFVHHISGIFASESVHKSKKAAFAELLLAALRGVDPSAQSEAHAETLLFLAERVEKSNKDWESHMEFMSCVLSELKKQDARTRSLFASPKMNLMATSIACRENLAIPPITSVLSSLLLCQAELLDAASLMHIYRTISSVLTEAQSSEDADDSTSSEVIGALSTIKGSLFNKGIPDDYEALSVWSEVVLNVAKLTWMTTGKDNKTKYPAAEAIWNSGQNFKELYSRLPQLVQKVLVALQEIIVQSLQSLQEGDAKRVAQQTAEILNLAVDPNAKNRVMEVVLASCNTSWARRHNRDGSVVTWDRSYTAADNYSEILNYLVSLLEHVDYSDLFGGSAQSMGRPWLAVEILCECQSGNVGSEVYDELVDHLVVSSLLAMSREGRVEDLLIVQVLKICMDCIVDLQESGDFVKVVHAVLGALLDHVSEDGTVEIMAYFVSSCLDFALHPDDEPSSKRNTNVDILLDLLPLIVGPLRMSDSNHYDNSGLGDMSLKWIKTASSLPPLTSANEALPSLRLRTIQCALSFFPVNDLMKFGKNGTCCVSYSEIKALMGLFRYQATTSDDQLDSDIESTTAASRQIRSMLGNLDLIATAYCHDLLMEEDWRGMLERVQAVVHGASLCLDNVVEIFSGAVVSIAESHAQVENTTMGLQLIEKMTEKGLIDGSEVIEAVDSLKASGMLEDLTTSTASVKSLIMLLTLDPDGTTAIGQDKWLCEQVVNIAMGHGARCALCGAAILCIAGSCGKNVFSEVVTLMSETAEFWDAIAELTEIALANGTLVSEALESMDLWASETGVEGVQCALALAFSPHPFPKLQKVGAQMLAQGSTILQLTFEGNSEADAELDMELQVVQEADSSVFLINSGIQRGLAPFLLSRDSLQHFLLAWGFTLAHLLALPEGSNRRKHLTSTLSDPFTLISTLLDKLALMLPLPENNMSAVNEKEEMGGKSLSLQGFLAQVGIPSTENEWEALAMKMYRSVLTVLPTSARTWFADLKDRNLVGALEAYTAANESQALIMRELGLVEASADDPSQNFRTKCIASRGEVIATKEIEDGALHELVIRLPKCMPLRPVEVDCQKRIGVSECQQRKWLLSICAFLRHQNSSILEAVTLWKRNLEKGFQGVEPCLICYSVIHPSTRALPELRCITCSVQFHAACLYRWFRQCGKSQCPHCQSPWSSGGRPE